MQLSIILLHITKVVQSLTRRGTSLVHFYGQLLYIDFCRLVGMGIQLSIIAILLYRALLRAAPCFPPRASTATAAPIPSPILPPALTPKVARATTRESPRTQNAKSSAEAQCPEARGYFPNVKGQWPTAKGQMQDAKKQALTETGLKSYDNTYPRPKAHGQHGNVERTKANGRKPKAEG